MSEVGLELALGKAIQDARKNAGLTQQELCMRTGISYSTLAKIERGAIKSPSVFTVAHIAKITNTTVEELTGAPRPTLYSVNNFKKAKNGIEFVYFDINGCLVRFFQRAFTKLAVDTGTSPDLAENIFWHYNDAVCRGEMTIEDFNNILAEKLNIPSVNWQEYYLSGIEPIKEALDVLKWTAKQFKVGLLSNIMPGFIDALINRGILPKINYSAIIDSSKIGAIKPESKIFEIATDKADVKAQDILLIDDSRPNLMAAQKMGWHVLWFDDFRPDESVKGIKQTLEI